MEAGKIIESLLKAGAERMLRQPAEKASQEEVSPGNNPEDSQEIPGKNLMKVNDVDPVVEQLADKVERANMGEVAKVTHEALANVMLGWKDEKWVTTAKR